MLYNNSNLKGDGVFTPIIIMNLDYTIPCIKIFISKNLSNDDLLHDVQSGVEEESIPYDIEFCDNDDALALSYEGASQSTLEVGIGIDSKGILVVHYRSLPKNKPLFKINYNIEPEQVRGICSNAARLVKGTPFMFL